jgi:hypothetical protein
MLARYGIPYGFTTVITDITLYKHNQLVKISNIKIGKLEE